MAYNLKELSQRPERFAPGQRMCAGCGSPIAMRAVLRAVLRAWAVTIAGVVARVVLVVVMAPARSAAVIVATVLAVAHLRALPVAFRSPALCRGIHTGQ